MNIKYFFTNVDGNLYLNSVLLDAIYIISPTSTDNSVDIISAYDKNLSLLNCKIDEIQFDEIPLNSVSQFRELAKDLLFKQSSSSSTPSSSGATSDNQIAGNQSLSNIDADLGTKSDAAATTDIGNFSLISLFKRGLQNWTSLLAKIPSLGTKNASASFPVTQSVETAVGVISTQNLNPNGVATANSAVEISLQGNAQLAIQTVGTYTGALSIQVTIDGTNWLTVTASSLLKIITGTYLPSITSAEQSAYQFECSGLMKVRITALAAVTGNVTVNLRANNNISLIGIDAPLPAGTNTLGNIATVTTVTGVTTVSTVTTVTNVTSITDAGTPKVPATPYFVNSLAGTKWSINTNGNIRITCFLRY
jgi:hypothetical protein